MGVHSGCLEMLSVWARGSMCRSGSTHVVSMRKCVGEQLIGCRRVVSCRYLECGKGMCVAGFLVWCGAAISTSVVVGLCSGI